MRASERTISGEWAGYLFIHEFAHHFAGLADEYYTSNVAYDGFYPEGYEPVERNITALDDPANVKWKDLVTADTALPTEWNKAAYDATAHKLARLFADNFAHYEDVAGRDITEAGPRVKAA